MTQPPDFATWNRQVLAEVESFLEARLPTPEQVSAQLARAMRYSTLDGGKRIRPLLAYAAGELTGACRSNLCVIASSVELIHAYSLVHDDMPAMDNDVLRRGKPTCHVAFGEAIALLAGDAMQSLAFDWLSNPGLLPLPAEQRLALVRNLALACGPQGMAGGQALDLENVSQSLNLEQLENMHRQKTGALIEAAVMMGAAAGESLSETDARQLSQAAQCLGLAFQVVDDILDAEMDSATLGKTAGKDAAANKPTYVSIMGLAESKRLGQELHQVANHCLDSLSRPAHRLKDLAAFMIERRN
jgi:farnesyl diphosphate synthase